MRTLRLAVAFAATMFITSLASPVGAALAPSCTLTAAQANAGSPVHWSAGCNAAETLTFHTGDGSAVAGTDYDATGVTVAVPVGGGSVDIPTPTHVNAAAPGKTLIVYGALWLNGKQLASTTASIVDPVPAPPPPVPAPAPVPSGLAVLDEGDSISYFWAANHTGLYAAAHPSVVYKGNAVSGSALNAPGGGNGLIQRQAADLALHPKVMAILIGANDVHAAGNSTLYPTVQDYIDALFAYIAPFRAAGTKVALGTILPQCTTGNPESGNDLLVNTHRAVVNAAIRAAVGTKIDAVIDYAADPAMGPDVAACGGLYKVDHLHPTDGNASHTSGQDKLEAIYAPVVDALLTAPTETAADNPMTGQSPGLGAPDVATADHNVLDDLQKSWGTGAIPASNAPDVVGAFRFICRHSGLAYDDPTVYHDQPGKSHLHDQTGLYGWNAFTNYGNARLSGGGSACNDVAGTDHDQTKLSHAANRTPYWQPALLDGKGNVIVADWTGFYYKRRPLTDPVVSDPTNPKYQGKAVPLPNGIKFIFGAFANNSSAAPVPAIAYLCTNGAAGSVYPSDGTFAGVIACAKAHSDGSLEVRMSAPDCWDGVNLDTPDHRSHLAYVTYAPGYAKCDAAHPYVIPTFTYAAVYTVLPTDTGDIHWSSDEMDNSKPRGWSFHVDYGPASWDPVVKGMWEGGCLDKLLNCSGGDLGNGLQLKGAQVPIYYDATTGKYTASFRNPVRLVPVPARPTTAMPGM